MENSIIKILKALIAKYGLSLFDDPITLRGLLKDHCGDLKKEINLIMFAQKEKIPHDIIRNPSKTVDSHQFKRLTSKLIDNIGLQEDSARWAVECWVNALGKASQNNKVQEKIIVPKKPLPYQMTTPKKEVFIEKKNVFNDTIRTTNIGRQIWMAENLKVDHYRNGDPIPEVQNPFQWGNHKMGAWCYYENKLEYGKIYGKLYNWYAVHDPRGLAPVGWHVPTHEEWAAMTSFLGGEVVAGAKLKECGSTHWKASNLLATNEIGFTALPGGFRISNGNFYSIGDVGFWWSSIEYDNTSAWARSTHYINAYVYKSFDYKPNGYSIRCVKNL